MNRWRLIAGPVGSDGGINGVGSESLAGRREPEGQAGQIDEAKDKWNMAESLKPKGAKLIGRGQNLSVLVLKNILWRV